jgi:HlyD family secretion protein
LVLTARGRTRIVLEPDERNLALLALGQKAAVSAEAFPESSFEATLGYIAPAVNGERGTIEVRLDVPNPPAYLRPNMTVSVELSIETRSHSLALPLAAVQDLGSARPWVGVLGARGRVEHRDVHLGLRGDTLVEVSSGLASGERVVFEPPAEPKARQPPVGE